MGKEIQVVDGSGVYQAESVKDFLQRIALDNAGVNYVVAAIMGPQSSGKSTLLNLLFGTDFKMMNAEEGRHQTTKGIWLDQSVKTTEVPTLIMDLEGSDGRERGEDDTTFERQSALFALASADILLINMFAVNIGRVQGSGAPLLKTIFQVNLKLFQPAPGRRKTVLIFVVRDRTKTPFDKLCADLRSDLDAIWDALVKPPEYSHCAVTDFFDVNYTSLPSYEVEQEDFVAEATILRRRFLPSHEQTLIRPDDNKVPGSAVSLHLEELWRIISNQRDLDLPAHKVMVANIRCQQISADQLASVTADQAWLSLVDPPADELNPSFRETATALVESCLYGYDQEAIYFAESVRQEVKVQLHQKLLQQLEPAYARQLALVEKAALERLERAILERPSKETFKGAASRGCEAAAEEFQTQVHSHLYVAGSDWNDGSVAFKEASAALVARLVDSHVAACMESCTEAIEAAVDGPTREVMSSVPSDLWVRMRQILKDAVKQGVLQLNNAVAGYGLPQARLDELARKLTSTASTKLVEVIKEDARRVGSRMLAKFDSMFEEDCGVPRVWTPSVDVKAVAAQARCAAALVLAQLAVTPVGVSETGAPDAAVTDVQKAIVNFAQRDISSTSNGGERSPGEDLLTMYKWNDVPAEAVLIPPKEARDAWRQFMQDSKKVVNRAAELQDERRRSSTRGPPLWAVVALIFFAWDDVWAYLGSPVLLSVFVVVGLILYQLYTELEVDREMERGLVPALISISRKFMPVTKRLVSNTRDSFTHVLSSALSDDTEQPNRSDSDSSSGTHLDQGVELTRRPSGRQGASPTADGLRKRNL